MNGTYWRDVDGGDVVFCVPLSAKLASDDLSAIAHQDLGGPKYLGSFGLSETPNLLKAIRRKANGHELTVSLGGELAHAINFTKPIHVELNSAAGVSFGAYKCLPRDADIPPERNTGTSLTGALIVLFVLTAVAVAGLLLRSWILDKEQVPPAPAALTATVLPSPSVVKKPAQPEPSAAPQPTWSRQKAEEEAEHLRVNGTPEQMMASGRILADMGAGDLAAALFRKAGDRGLAVGWLSLGRLYDPRFIDRDQYLSKDAKIAYFNYRRAAAAGVGPAETEASQLLSWLRDRAASGEALAVKLLQDLEQ